MPRAVVHRHVEKPVHNALENFQRFMLDNPMTSLRNKMSDLNVSAYSKSPRRVKTGNPSEHTRMSMDRTERYDKSNTLPPQSAMFASEPPSSSPRVDRLAPIRKQRKDGHDLDQSSEPGLTARLMTMTSNPLSGDLRYEAGYSELQAAFERAYQKMLHEQQPSVVDTILSTAWNPAAKRSAMSRTFFKKEQDKSSSWDTRAPVYEKKTFYDSLEDTHCRRVVTNMKLKQILHKTRPQSEHLLQMRLLEERQSKESGYLKKRGKGRRSKRRGQELWVETLQRFMQTSKDQKKDEMLTRIAAQPQQGRSGAPSHHSDEAAEAEERREEGSAAAREAAEEGGMQDHWERTETDPAPTGGEPEAMAGGEEEGERRPPGSIEELKSVWMQAKEGGAIQLKALSTMIMKEENRVEAFEYIKEEVEFFSSLRPSCRQSSAPSPLSSFLSPSSLLTLCLQVENFHHLQVKQQRLL
uniref:Uncharacterized protein n=1 Tax=Guillardia theta TaxID=55529 RepID=A0A7S4H9Z3_GUITH|mmetsp:Transcript_11641/g.40193  ORF Transcript_11641/g.40193 Transcript_11641/m.40193 type:complete len:467 (+) Transcript_11641:186-1586(+)